MLCYKAWLQSFLTTYGGLKKLCFWPNLDKVTVGVFSGSEILEYQGYILIFGLMVKSKFSGRDSMAWHLHCFHDTRWSFCVYSWLNMFDELPSSFHIKQLVFLFLFKQFLTLLKMKRKEISVWLGFIYEPSKVKPAPTLRIQVSLLRFDFPKLNLLTNSNWWKTCFCCQSGNIKSRLYIFVRG